MDQPYSRMADMLLDTQYYNVNDPRPYDDTGWTLGALRNVKTVRVTDKSALQAPMTLLVADAKVTGAITSGASSPVAYLINHNAENTLMTLRFKLKDLKIAARSSTRARSLSSRRIIPASCGRSWKDRFPIRGSRPLPSPSCLSQRATRWQCRASRFSTRGRIRKTTAGSGSSSTGCRFLTRTSLIKSFATHRICERSLT